MRKNTAGPALFSAVTLLASACASHQTAPAQAPRPSSASRELSADLSAVFGARLMERGVWAVDVRSLDTGERLYALNAGKLTMPASNMKILTLAGAAETLGWDHRFITTLETSGTVTAGVLRGDLIVRGNGDPTINARNGRAAAVLDEWAAALRDAGISSIEGRVLGDDQAFDDEGIGAGWAWDYLQFGYAAPVGALQFNESTASLTVTPSAAAGEPALVNLSPGSGFVVLNRALTGAAGSAESIDFRRHLDNRPFDSPDRALAQGGPVLEISGSIPAGGAPLGRSVAVVNPTLFFAQSLKDGLIVRGISFSGEAIDMDDLEVRPGSPQAAGLINQPERRALATTRSPPLGDIATVLMKVSQNLYAETLLKAAGAARDGLGTWPGGRRVVAATLAQWGVPADSYVMYDGSGLSRYNYVTAETVTTVLAHLYKDPRHKEPFLATLPIAGKDGSMASRLKRTRAESNAVAKTGSIANVRSLSGFVRTRDGEMLVFSILCNDFVIPAATVNYIADLAVEILSNFTRR